MKIKVSQLILFLFILILPIQNVYAAPISKIDEREVMTESLIDPIYKWGIVGLGPAATLAYGYMSWWHNTSSSFHFNPSEGLLGRSSYSGGSDKFGHMFASFYMSRTLSYFLEELGENKPSALFWGAMSSSAAFSLVEIFDGFDLKTGAGGWDMVFNLAGSWSAYLLGQSHWLSRVIQPSFRYFPSDLFLDQAEVEKNYFNISEDYNGWTYYLDFHPTQIPFIHQELVKNAYTDFFGNLLELNLSFRTNEFKPHGWFPRVETAFGVGIDVTSIFEFFERRHRMNFGIAKNLSQYMKVAPDFALTKKSWNYKRIGDKVHNGGPDHIVPQ